MAVIDDAIAQINNFIVQNGNEAITANVLRPILLKMTDAIRDEVNTLNNRIDVLQGDLNNLNGVKKFTGTIIPNINTDLGQTAGDIYIRVFSGNTIASYQFNGINWIEII